jgi:hypothetical protein
MGNEAKKVEKGVFLTVFGVWRLVRRRIYHTLKKSTAKPCR